jgi:hypothetical protein
MPSVSSVFAIGPSDVDPRTGEILNADILFTADWVRRAHERVPSSWLTSPTAFIEREEQARELARLLNPDDVGKLCAYEAGLAPHIALLNMTLMS